MRSDLKELWISLVISWPNSYLGFVATVTLYFKSHAEVVAP